MDGTCLPVAAVTYQLLHLLIPAEALPDTNARETP